MPNAPPPRLAVRLLDALLADEARDAFVGDLLERFDGGAPAARRRFWGETLVALARLPWRRPFPSHAGDPVLQATLTEMRHAGRRLRRAPGFTALAAVTLAVGVGATTAVFSTAYSALLRPLPYPDAGRLVDAAETVRGQPYSVSPANFADWRRESRTMDLVAWNNASGALTSDGPAEQLALGQVSDGFFRVAGVRPALGRPFSAAEGAHGGPRAAILGHELWVRRFGGDARVVGRSIRLDGESYDVVGVMPRGFDFPSHAQLWVPLTFEPDDLVKSRGAHWLRVLGRLRPGATVEGARAELAAQGARLAAAYPATNTGEGATVRTLRDATVGDVRPALVVLLGGVGLLLLLACANVANLLLVRATRRERERVVRAALGAGRGALARAVLSEAVLLAAVGGAAGVALAWWGTRALDATLRAARPGLAESRVDGPVLAFALGLSLLTALAFGLLPALGASRMREIASALRAAGPGAGGRGGRRAGSRLRGALVGAQVTLTTLLLTSAVLLGESFRRLRQVDVGFDPKGVWTFSVAVPEARYDYARTARFYHDLLTRVRALPGVTAAGATLGLPLSGASFSISLHDVDGVPVPDAGAPSTSVRVVTDDYFRAVGMTVTRGRSIAATDDERAPRVLVVNEALARMVWPGRDPIGHQLAIGWRMTKAGGERERVHGEVVGVVRDVRGDAVQHAPRPEAYFAAAQFPIEAMSVAVRARSAPTLAKAVAAQVTALDPELPVYQERTLDALVADAVAEPRLYSLLFAAFAGTALLLAAVGVYGVVSLAVGQRTREFGVRVALGARPGDVARLVLRQALVPVAGGLALGLFGALGAGRLLRTLLFGVRANEPAALAAVAVTLAAVAAAAVLAPTRRATAVAPKVALLDE